MPDLWHGFFLKPPIIKMKIQEIIQNHGASVAQLFQTYGINKPVNLKTVSSAIVVYSTPDGNVFLEDLARLADADISSYEDLLGFGKKGKARRQEKREARGGYSRFGNVLRKVGIAKNRPPKGVKTTVEKAESPIEGAAVEAEQTPTNEGGAIVKGTMSTAQKLSGKDILEGVGQIASTGLDLYSKYKQNQGGGDGGPMPVEGGDGGGGETPTGFDWKKYLPFIIGGGVLIVGILFFALRKK